MSWRLNPSTEDLWSQIVSEDLLAMRNPVVITRSSSSSLSPSSSPSSLASALFKPLNPSTFNPSNDGNDGFSQSSLGYYAEIALALVEEGRFEEFGSVVEGLVDLGAIEAVDFGRLVNLELLDSGIGKGLKEGRVKGVVPLLSSVAKLQNCVLNLELLRLIDGDALQSITMEVCKFVNDGNVKEVVELMELLSDCQGKF